MDRTSPFADLDRVFAEMDRRFDEMRRSMGATVRDRSGALPVGHDADGLDANIDLHETDDGFVLYADLPGFEREEIDLAVDDGMLAIDAVREMESDGVSRSRRVHEHATLPKGVDEDAITASYRNGVLEVSLPVSETFEDSRHIPIED